MAHEDGVLGVYVRANFVDVSRRGKSDFEKSRKFFQLPKTACTVKRGVLAAPSNVVRTFKAIRRSLERSNFKLMSWQPTDKFASAQVNNWNRSHEKTTRTVRVETLFASHGQLQCRLPYRMLRFPVACLRFLRSLSTSFLLLFPSSAWICARSTLVSRSEPESHQRWGKVTSGKATKVYQWGRHWYFCMSVVRNSREGGGHFSLGSILDLRVHLLDERFTSLSVGSTSPMLAVTQRIWNGITTSRNRI